MAKPIVNKDFLAGFDAQFNNPNTDDFLAGFDAQFNNTQENKGFFSNSANLLQRGGQSAIASADVSTMLLAGTDPVNKAKTIAKELSTPQPVNPKELQEAQAAFVDEAAAFEKAKHWYSPDALVATAGMLGEFGKQILTNPEGAAYITEQSAANMVPAIVSMMASSRIGAGLGSIAGPGGATVGGIIGGVGGAIAGQVPMETGSEFIGLVGKELSNRKLAPTEANVNTLFADKKWLNKAISDARTKGITTAAVDGATTMLGGRLATAPRRAAIEAAKKELGAGADAVKLAARATEIIKDTPRLKKISAGAQGVGLDVVGGGASEAAGQEAAYGKVNLADVGQEMLGELGGSAIEVPAAAYSATRDLMKPSVPPVVPPAVTPAGGIPPVVPPTVPPVVTPAGVPPVVNPVLTDADVEDLQEEPITSSTFVPKTGDKVNVTWKNTGEHNQQTATGEVVTWKDGSQYVKVETGQLENGKITYSHVPIANANVQVTPIETAPVATPTATPAVQTQAPAATPVETAPVSPNTPLHTVVNNETKMEASVYPRDNGTFNVAQKDLESGKTLDTFKNFKTQEEAIKYAETIQTPVAPKPTEVVKDTSELEKKVSSYYQDLLDKHPDASEGWKSAVQELAGNPNRDHKVQEQENPKGIKVGDTVISGFGKTAKTNTVLSVTKDKALIDSGEPNRYGGWTDLDQLNQPNVEPTQLFKDSNKTFNFGTGEIDVSLTRMGVSPETYKNIYKEDGGILSFDLRGDGLSSETGYRSASGISYTGKMTPERLEEIMLSVAQEHSKKPKTPAQITKEEKIATNLARQDAAKAKKEAAKKASEYVDTSAVSDVIVKSIKKKDGYVIYKRESDPEFWLVQSPENKAKNRIGNGDTPHANLGTATDQIYENLNNEQLVQKPVKETPNLIKAAEDIGKLEIVTVTDKKPTKQPKSNYDIDTAKKDLDDALSDLGSILSASTRANIMPEEEQKLIPVLVRVMDAAFRLGYYKFKDASKFVLDTIRNKFGKDVADKISLDHLQGAYISMAGRYEETDTIVTVATFNSLDEIMKEAKNDLSNADSRFKASSTLADFFIGGGKFSNIVEARKKIAEILGLNPILPGTNEAKQADETVESAIVIAGRKTVEESRKSGLTTQQTYDKLLDLYNRQPNLSMRSSTSVRDQAYSTPLPLAYVASEFAGINDKTTVLEPTAGNGMLLVGANPKNVTANELNPSRSEMIKLVIPEADVTTDNATTITYDKKFDAVIENPPFGSVRDDKSKTITFDINPNYKTIDIDHAIVMKSLEAMKDNGRAVLLVGGTKAETNDARREDYRGKSKREFYYNLYKDYNVVDHFSISGSMYTKQGASFPVDIIVINGRGKSSRNLPASELPNIIASYEKLKEKLNEASRMVPRGDIVTTGTNVSPSTTGGVEQRPMAGSPIGQGNRPSTEGTRPTTVSETGVQVPRPAVSGQPTTTGGNISESQSGVKNNVQPSNEQGGVPSTGETKSGSTTSAEGNKPTGLGKPSEVRGESIGSGLKDRRGLEEETSNQVTYNPYSQGTAIGTLVPRAMSESINNAIQKVQDEVGNLDNYVADALNMDVETLKEKFSAEQIDALVLAIRNAEAGKGFIIGDQTGVGKGRVVAAMIKYALVNGKIPIFVTEKPNLYSDMIRDLDDIGMTKELGLDTKVPKILMTNSSDTVPYSLIRNVKGEVVENEFTLKSPKSGASLNNLMSDMISKNSIGDYKVIFTTYSQLQTVKGQATERQRFISNFAEGNYLICDESHNAGGTGDAKAKEGTDSSTGRAKFVRNLVSNSFGSFFSSATYAKRPDVMDLYSSTNMSLAVDRPDQLAEAIKHGGIPMQQMVANMLTKDGQYIRRERTFAGVTYDTHETKVDKKTAENMATAMRKVLEFSRAKEPIVKDMQKDLDKAGAVASILGEKTTIQSANFGSIMHNLIDQMLLSLKVEDSINLAIEKLKAGEKVVMTVSNTMGSFLENFAKENDINIGDEVNLSFKDVYQKYLQKQREVTIKLPDGTKEKYYLTDDDLGPRLTSMFNNTRDSINGFGFGSAPISPIDYMHSKLQEAGYTTDEITGRTNKLNYAGGTATYGSRSSNIKQRVNAVRNFNNGTTDVIILNQAGSTGLSLHASDKFKDQRKRNMIIVQPEKNIDTHMQMLGRVHRTGQIQTPSYYQMMADIPAEMRPAAVLLKKMASLNANTTASRKSAITAEGTVDFMNDYGGQVAQEYLRDNPDVSEAIGDRVDLKDDSTEGTEEDIRKLTGYIPILPIKQQEEIYKDLIDRYNDLIESENNLGTNKLEAKAMDLDAETISTVPITEHKGGTSVFAEPANMERIDIKRTVKPYSSEEVKADIKENLDGKTSVELAREKNKDLFDRTKVYRDERLAKANEENADDVKLNTIKQQITTTFNHVKTINETYRIGDAVSVKDSKGVFVYGVITNTNSSNRTANPSAPSDWKMHIALANGDAKSITLTYSQIGKQFTLEKQPYNVDYLNTETLKTEYIPVIDMFDKASTTRREKRWMVTGNILAGFALHPGQIVTFTKQDGSVSQGVLMSRNFDNDEAQKKAPVKIKSAEDVIKSLNQFYGSSIGTLDSILQISKDRQEYVFTVPSSKKTGGTYFLDKGLTDAIGNDFFKRNSIMNARAYGETNALRAINYIMQNREEPLYAITDKQEVKAFLYPKVESARGKARLTGQTAETVLQRLHGEFGKAGINSMMNRGLLTIVNNADELPANIKSEIDATTVAAHSEGKVYLIANRLEPDRVRSSLLHEIGEHYGLRAIVGEEAYSNILNEIDRLRPLDATVRDAFTHVEKMYPDLKGNRDRINREVLARVGEEAPQHSLWRKIVSAFKTFLIKHGFKTNLTTADIHDLVQYSLHKAMKGDIAQTSQSTDLSKYQSEWAALSKERMESLLSEGIYHGTDNDWRTRSWIAQVDPRKFVEATTTSAEDIKRIEKRAGKLNLTKLREESQTPFIYIENGEITGHEGRHRMIALAKAGITRVPVVVRQRGEASNKYRQDFMELKGQKFDGSGRGKTLEVYNAIPLNMAERNTARQEYTKDNELRSIEFSRINAEEDQRVLDDLGVPAVPSHDQKTFKEFLLGGWKKTQETAVDVYHEPKENTSSAITKTGEFLTLQRIRNFWYGAGLEAADMARYSGQIRDAFGRLLPSIALKNAIKSAYISTRVILDGGLEMNTMHGIFMAVKKAHSMANIFTMQANLRKDIGTELADRVINSYFVAKRSRGIQERYFEISKEIRDIEEQLLVEEDQNVIVQLNSELESAKQDLKNIKIAYEKIPAYLCKIDEDEPTIKTDDGKEIPNVLYDKDGLPQLNDDAMDALINQEEKYSDLTEMMTNWTAVNHNMLDMMAFSGRISKKMADKLKAIKDYSPWARIIDERQDLYDARLMSTRTTGIKHFKAGRTELDVDNVIEAMTNNVQQMVKSTLRTYAYNRIAIEYGSRKPNVVDKKTGVVTPGKLRVFPDQGRFAGQGVRIPIFANGKQIIIQIEDTNVAEAMLGLAMAPVDFPFQNLLSKAANFTRRSITFSLYFQAKQVFYDAPTAAWVSGVRNPLKLWAGCFSGFARAVNPIHDDATAMLLQSAGFGGFQSHHRSAKGELQLELGILNHSLFSRLMKGIDKFGDASDLSQRIPIYEQTIAETGDPMLAILKASDVMDFQKSGNGKMAQFLKVTIPFIQAWATQIDALGQAMVGGNLKGMSRKEAQWQFAKTGTQLAGICLLYAMAAGGDDDYWELDDETRLRNFYIPGSKKVFGHHVLIPMHSSASFFFKVMPEWLYSTITSQSTKNAIDATRFRKVLAESAVNSILGPTPIPSGVKPTIEIAFNHDFYTGNTVTPRGLENLDAAQQYNASTSELGKMLSSLTGTDKSRLLNPIEADKFMRGMAGSIASLSQYYSNVLNSGNRVMPQIKDNPLVGGLVGADTQRKYENLFYGLRDETESAEATFKKLHERGMHEEADAYLRDNIELVKAQGYVKAIGEDLGRLNKEIKRVGESPKDKTFNTPQKRLDRINELKEIKNNILKDVVQVRKQAGL